MSGLPCAKVILDGLALLGGSLRCVEAATWLRTHASAPPLTEAEAAAVKELIRQAEKKIEEAGKIIGKPFAS